MSVFLFYYALAQKLLERPSFIIKSFDYQIFSAIFQKKNAKIDLIALEYCILTLIISWTSCWASMRVSRSWRPIVPLTMFPSSIDKSITIISCWRSRRAANKVREFPESKSKTFELPDKSRLKLSQESLILLALKIFPTNIPYDFRLPVFEWEKEIWD